MLVSPHFDSSEFAQKAGYELPALPYPRAWIETRLRPLCLALELLRRQLGGRPVEILSGYRSPVYNERCGGAPKSQHLAGRAADVRVEGVAPLEVHQAALRLYDVGDLAIGGLGLYDSFIHVDVRGGPLARWDLRKGAR